MALAEGILQECHLKEVDRTVVRASILADKIRVNVLVVKASV